MTTQSRTASVTAGDRRLARIAAVGIAISLAAGVARLLHVLPSGAAAAIVLVGVVIGLRVALIYASRAATSAARAKTMTMVANVGLAVSAVTIVAALPHLTKQGGAGHFFSDAFGQLWTLGVLTIAAGPVRTIGWRGLVGAGLAGFLAVTGLSRLVGRPLVNHFGATSLPVVAGVVPFTEELFKLLPVLLVVLLAIRRTDTRRRCLISCCSAHGRAPDSPCSRTRRSVAAAHSSVRSHLSHGCPPAACTQEFGARVISPSDTSCTQH